MNFNSLKLRLLVAAGLAISVLLLIAGFSFFYIFQRYVERVAISQLDDQYIQLVNRVRIDDSGKLFVQGKLSDPRFSKPYGGLYWQINESNLPPVRSLSLFDEIIAAPKDSQQIDGNIIHLIGGPNGSRLFSLEKQLVLPIGGGVDRKLSILMAVDRISIDETVGKFGGEILRGLGYLWALLLATTAAVILLGLRPLEALRRDVGAIRLGGSKQISGHYPSEVEGLVSELNGLLFDKHEQLERTRLRVSNLAHGLKTPLTIISSIGDSVERAGLRSEAREIHDGVTDMNGLVERELARARMATGHAVQLSKVQPVVLRVVGALDKTSGDHMVRWQVDVPAEAQVQVESGDLLELTGILLDNASKWAKTQVNVFWRDGGLTVEDDGPGVPDDKLAVIQKRGVRLDESVPGSGLGLGIARDIVDIYGYRLVFARSKLGGLSVRFEKA